MTRQQTARLAGALYFAMGLPGAFTLIYMPSVFVVPGDATATAMRIAAAPGLYRFGVLADLLCAVFAMWLVVVLYDIFKDVDRSLSRLMVCLALGMAAAGFVNMVALAAPLVLTSGAGYLSAFDKQQVDALVLLSLGLRTQGVHAATMYWGLWLLPLGMLVYRSGFLPRTLGTLLVIAGCAYVATSLSYYLLPAQARLVALASMLPQAAAEGGFAVWMLVKGVHDMRTPDPAAR